LGGEEGKRVLLGQWGGRERAAWAVGREGACCVGGGEGGRVLRGRWGGRERAAWAVGREGACCVLLTSWMK